MKERFGFCQRLKPSFKRTVATAHSIRHTRSVSDEAKKLLEEAMKLPVRQRARLVSSLIDSLEESDEADVEQAWIEEVYERARELDTGRVRGLTWAEARRIMLGP
jgi:putative addiction module component (TIGR02574 family)